MTSRTSDSLCMPSLTYLRKLEFVWDYENKVLNSTRFQVLLGRLEWRTNMSLKKEYVRDGNRQIIGSVTSGFSDESSVVRDEHEQILGRTSDRFHTTRDANGGLVSSNTSDPGLLIKTRK